MRDALERDLAARLHALGEAMLGAVDAPAGLDLRVRRRRRVQRRRKAAAGVAAAVVLVAGIAIAAVVSSPPAHPGVHVATPGRVTADQIDPSVVLLDAKGRFVVGLDAGGHQRETLVATTNGQVVDAQVTADHTTIWYLTVKGKAGIDCGNVVRANVTTGASHVMFRAIAFAVNPAGTRVALSGENCTPSASGELGIIDLSRGEIASAKVSTPPSVIRWAPDGATIATQTCVIIVCSVSTYASATATRIATMSNATAPVFGGDTLYVTRPGGGRTMSVVRTDVALRAPSTIYSAPATSVLALPTSAALFVSVNNRPKSMLVSLGPGSGGATIATPVRVYEYGTLVPVPPLG